MNRLWIISVFISTLVFAQPKKELITIHFDSNSTVISQNETQLLASFFSNQNEIAQLQINGFCDDVGTAGKNLILSEKRANTIADYLKNNFKLNATVIIGKGEKKLTSTSQKAIEKERAEHRCVTIEIGYADKTTAEKAIEKKAQEKPVANDGYKTFADELAVGDKIIIENILFIANRKVFDDDEKATAELQKIIAYLQKNPTVQFEISGHVCCISKSFKDAHDRDSGLNNLSETRAKRVYDYFAENDIAKERMSHKGYGRQFPRPNMPEKDNKRVEIVITKL